jgi:transcriptional regulator with XRE-family HTH domain
MNVIGKLLCCIRQSQNFTQEELVSDLAASSLIFESLNSVTLSRWETGKTSTSYSKKRELLKIFSRKGWLQKGLCHDFVRNRFENMCQCLTVIFDHNYQSLIANVPTLKIGMDEYDLHNLQKKNINNKLYHFENIIDIEIASNPKEYYSATPESLQSLCSHRNSFSIICERRRQHLGHFLMFKLENDIAQNLIHNKISEFAITTNHLCKNNENGSYYIHALYGVNPTIAALVNSKAYLYMFDNMTSIDNVVILSSRKDGLRLAKAYGIRTVAKGKNKKYNFIWHGMDSPVEDILFSDTVLRLIF